jgi:hypothetical protein
VRGDRCDASRRIVECETRRKGDASRRIVECGSRVRGDCAGHGRLSVHETRARPTALRRLCLQRLSVLRRGAYLFVGVSDPPRGVLTLTERAN